MKRILSTLCLLFLLGTLARNAAAQSWNASGPLPRGNHSAILDTSTNRMIVFGGFPFDTNSTQNLNDVWRAQRRRWARFRLGPGQTQGYATGAEVGPLSRLRSWKQPDDRLWRRRGSLIPVCERRLDLDECQRKRGTSRMESAKPRRRPPSRTNNPGRCLRSNHQYSDHLRRAGLRLDCVRRCLGSFQR